MSSISGGRKVVTTAGTAVQLAPSASAEEVCITAETDNTGTIVVGGSGVVAALATRKGTPLAAGQSFSTLLDDLGDIWIDSTVNGDGVTFTYRAD
jgi:hypothetical protein